MKRHNISGVIGYDAMATDLNRFLAESKGEDVELIISSPGGLVGEALDMFNAIRRYEGKTTAILSGYAMSAASYIPMAADEVHVEDNAVMMIHNAQGIAWGDHNELDKTAKIMKGLSAILGQAYSKFTGKDKEEIAAMMDAETWFFGEEIVVEGFAHSSIARESEQDSDKEGTTAQARLAFSSMVAKMSGDKTLFHNDLSRAATALGATGAMPNIPKKEDIMDLKELKSKYPDLCAAIAQEAAADMECPEECKKKAEAKGFAEGVSAEQTRIKGVREQSVPGHEALVEQMAFDGKSTAADTAMAIVAAEKVIRTKQAESFVAGAPPVIPVVTGGDTGASLSDSAPIEDKAKLSWDKSPETREEFRNNFGAFLAFRKAEAAGQVRIFGKK